MGFNLTIFTLKFLRPVSIKVGDWRDLIKETIETILTELNKRDNRKAAVSGCSLQFGNFTRNIDGRGLYVLHVNSLLNWLTFDIFILLE